MKKASDLPYYPRFIFNCSDNKCFTTADVDELKYIKEVGADAELSRFKKGQNLEITSSNDDGIISIVKYQVSDIEIHQIKRDIDEPTYGFNKNDCFGSVFGKKKKWLMEIYIFLELLE